MSAQTLPTSSEEDSLRADCYRVLARLFAAAPDAELLAHLRGAASDAADAGGLGASWNALCHAAAADTATLADQFGALFIAIGAPPVVVYGSWYRDGSLMGASLVRLRDDLVRFGLCRQEDVQEPEDHIAALLDAMALLVSAGEQDQAALLRDHIAPWYARLCDALESQGESEFYRAAARFMRGFLDGEVELLLA